MQQHSVTADQIADVLVEVGGMGVMLCTPEEKRLAPLNGNDARYNIPFPLGATFVYGKPSLKDFTPEGIRELTALLN